MRQNPGAILMIRPVAFGYNPETQESNVFQGIISDLSELEIVQAARQEFDNFVTLLEENDINVLVVEDNESPRTPDAVFPNNWVSFHHDGTVILYPMMSEIRRKERREDIIEMVAGIFKVEEIHELNHYESVNKFLEGTGSIVFDHNSQIAYACHSDRTDPDLLDELCQKIGYRPIVFTAVDKAGEPIYHTNVMMCIGEGFAVICRDSITDPSERKEVIGSLEESGLEVVNISMEQMFNFAGNMFGVISRDGRNYLIMSLRARRVLSESQVTSLEKYSKILSPDLKVIEQIGGGSARCMIAGIHLPEN